MDSPSTTTGDGPVSTAPAETGPDPAAPAETGPDPAAPAETGPMSTAATPGASGGAPPAHPTARWGRGAYAVVAIVAYLPMLLTKPGVVSDDTKTYLYLDPGTWTRTSASIWDPNVALGSVTHETIGYLFPMGPYYWAMALVHVPTWVAQRLWLGTIVFAAGAGVLYLADALDLRGAGRLTAALAYSFTPYVMQYSGRISVILMPFAGLPWLLAFVIRALRTRGWKYPALFALTVAVISGINASSVIYVGMAPVLWLPFDVFVAREVSGRQAWGVFFKVGALSLLASLWWIAGLTVEGAFGINVLRYTESVQATSSTSNAAEVMRGLGYWYFYGGDRMGLWTQAADEFTQKLWLIALTYVLPIAAFVSAVLCRWRYRVYFVLLLAIGIVLSVGPYPFDHPTAYGALVKAFMTKTTAGLALRSTDRATPLVILGLAMLLGMGVSALLARTRTAGRVAFEAVCAAVLLADAPFFAGRTVISQFSQPASPPKPVEEAAAHLDATHPGTRVYSLPGNNFAAYRWGDTVDPVWPALLDRPYVVHEQQIQGSLPTADLLYALDAPLQQGTMDWNALAPMARLMSVGDVVVEYDQQYERYDTPRPAVLQQQLARTPPGLTDPISFGPPTVNRSSIPMLDETSFGLPTGTPPPSPIVTYTVTDPRPIVRGESLSHPLVVDGDAVGLVDAAGAGLLADDPTILYAGTLDKDPSLAATVLHGPADLVVTDANRKQSFEWNSLNDNTGYTETATEQPTAFVANDPGINLFPGTGSSAQATTVLSGIKSVTASAYGTAYSLRSEWRPANAIDGNPTTAWETEGDSGVPNGNWWQVTLDHPTTTGSVTLLQPQPVNNEAVYTNQWITRATLTFDGKDPVTVDLGPRSRSRPGQVVTFPTRSFSTLRVRIDSTNLSTGTAVPAGSSLVGLAEVGIGQARATQVVQVPSDLLTSAGAAAATDRLTYLFTRDRVAPVPPRQDPEVALARQFDLTSDREFTLAGTARLSDAVADDVIDRLVGRTGGSSDVLAATSSSRMPGDLKATASATLDGDPSTAWSPGLGITAQQDSWLDYTLAAPATVDHLDLDVVSDAEHSRPTSITVTGDSGSASVRLPAIPVTSPAGSTTTVPVSFPPVTGANLRISFTGIAVRDSPSYETSLTEALPIAIAEVGIPGVTGAPLPAVLPSSCRSDLLTLDGSPVSVSVSGTTADALSGNGLAVALCGPDQHGLALGRGTHLLMATDGAVAGFDIDQVVLDSAPGTRSGPAPATAATSLPPAPPAAAGAPTVTVTAQDATRMSVRVDHATGPFLLVLGQSVNRGWSATVQGVGSLGAPTLVDGFANGWYVNRATLARAGNDGTFDVVLRFTPQRTIDVALIISGATLAACLGMVVVAVFRRRRRTAPTADTPVTHAPPALEAVRPVRAEFLASRPLRVVIGTVAAGLVA
ncbi:MAG: alpha-(1-_3)-arabinofuranosyltransferase family protein, partial [Acidimicrobiales bacterium]